MSIINTRPLAGASGNQGVAGYNLTKSLRFRQSAAAYLNRTPATTGNRKTWTFSFWLKRGVIGNSQLILAAGLNSVGNQNFNFNFTSDQLQVSDSVAGVAATLLLQTTQVFRDPSAWYHIVLTIDTTQATSTNRAKLYVNGVQVTALGTATYPVQNYDTEINIGSQIHNIGNINNLNAGVTLDGYLAEVNLVDGQALTPSSFGETDTITGVWKPKAYTGTYGTNGFYLPFTDVATTSGSNAGLGKDFSGNGNYWNTNNISVTAGTTYDSMTDVPTLTSATAANYPVWNPLTAANANYTFTNGNLNATNPSTSGANFAVVASMAIPATGQFYWELTATAIGGNSGNTVGIIPLTNYSGYNSMQGLLGYGYGSTGNKLSSGSSVSYGATWTTNDVIGVAYDAGAGSLTFYKNGTSQGVAFTGLSGQYVPAMDAFSVGGMAANFGQRPFAYTPPTGYLALNTYNLPDSTIVAGNKVMDATTYTGDGSTSRSITNAGAFKPDLVWFKSRTNPATGFFHTLNDSVRGFTSGFANVLYSNDTSAENTGTSSTGGGVSAFNSNGFSLANGSGGQSFGNSNTIPYVGWQWQAGQGSSSSNTSGSITSTVSVNASAGFSIVTYTGTGSSATVGHGLGVAPKFIIIKNRTAAAQEWQVLHQSANGGSGHLGALFLNLTSAWSSGAYFGNTAPTSSVFTIDTASYSNGNGNSHVAYCWSEIAGFSKFGSYTGNGSTDGPFVYTGFRPKFILVKNTGLITGYGNWSIIDTTRDSYNVSNSQIRPDESTSEQVNTAYNIDILSNGFKLRTAYNDFNASGYSFIYMAFAENPFKNSLAR